MSVSVNVFRFITFTHTTLFYSSKLKTPRENKRIITIFSEYATYICSQLNISLLIFK